ncbi:splicing factor 3B subunit 2 [Catharus ustulatus]|uniref:splicing factor 3B subunit 2 n=1 Tax=Catharus ustulatus TaxID=91951 RepID=UPI0014086939|nr:splicing factor 3B subunit 2 [Catharus ustulatus]
MAAERAEAATGAGGAGGGPGEPLRDPRAAERSPYAGWAHPELQATLAGIGAPAQGTREELVERLQAYTLQTGIVLSRPAEGDKAPPPQLPPALPPGLGLGFGLGGPVGGVPVPPPPPPAGMSEEERLTLAQQQAALLLQEERAQGQHPFGDKAKEQELLEQQKRAAVLLEQERQQQEMAAVLLEQERQQQEMAKLSPAPPRAPPEGTPLARTPLNPRGSPMGAPLAMGAPRPRGPPPPPGDDSREEEPGVGPKIPQALEKILQLKESRQEELVTAPGVAPEDEMETELRASASASEAEEDTGTSKKERNRKRRNRKKKKRGRGVAREVAPPPAPPPADAPEVEIEYVSEEPEIYDPNFVFFKRIFEAFKLTDEVKKDKEKEPERAERAESAGAPRKKGPEDGTRGSDGDSSEDEQEKKQEVPKLSKKKLRRMNRFTVAELKQLVARPDVVEMHDVTAQDPKLLVHLKATRNSVPVPRHWCFKRKYLQGKRGIEKPPFELPDFIKRTGIQEMREALQEKEEQKTMKSKMREKVRPKMGKIDIDYQKLHDAFFKWQTKPKLTIHGDLYYEGKEFETRLKEKKPGDLSDELRIALGMPVGPNAHKVPPPWLIAMQRYGPPPSYPNLKIPGLNSPIPEGCSFGYHAGGWGKPPVDETGKPLYGDVFGTNAAEFQTKEEEEEIDRTPWGELEPSDEESSEEEEEEESDEEKPDETGFITPADSGLITPGGFSSVPAGMETPELIELRKKKIEEAMDGSETPQLFTVVPEKRTATVGTAMMGSTHIYDMSAVMGRKGPVTEAQGVEVALAPEELELDPTAMTQKYEEHVREQQAQVEKEDFSDMVAEHAAKQKQKKRKAQPQDARGGGKKYKEFKF